jgi:hypothetical protein
VLLGSDVSWTFSVLVVNALEVDDAAVDVDDAAAAAVEVEDAAVGVDGPAVEVEVEVAVAVAVGAMCERCSVVSSVPSGKCWP